MKRNIVIGLAIFAIAVAALLSQKGKNIDIAEWECSGGWCTARMIVKNNKNYEVQSQIVIRAHNQERYDRDPGAKGNKVVGERYLSVILEPKKTKEIVEQFQLNYPARVHMLVARKLKTIKT